MNLPRTAYNERTPDEDWNLRIGAAIHSSGDRMKMVISFFATETDHEYAPTAPFQPSKSGKANAMFTPYTYEIESFSVNIEPAYYGG